MLIRISLIIAIIAGLAVGGLNFVKVKEKITTLVTERDNEKTAKEAAQKELATTKDNLNKTTAKLKQTEETLTAETEAKTKAEAEATAQQKRADKLNEDLTKTRAERDDAQTQLAAFRASGYSPEQVATLGKQYKSLQNTVAAVESENKVLLQRVKNLDNELLIYRNPDYQVALPAGLKGKVLVSDPKWNFVVVNVGADQGVLKSGELLVNRNGKLVAKVKVTSVEKDRSVANVVPGWELSEIYEGDQVIPAHPAS